MEKPHRGALFYGYTICLVAVITFLISTASLVNSIIDLGDPLHTGTGYGKVSLVSFENYKMDVLKAPQKDGETSKPTYIPDDQTLRIMYEDVKADRIQSAKHQSGRSIIVNSLLIIICVYSS